MDTHLFPVLLVTQSCQIKLLYVLEHTVWVIKHGMSNNIGICLANIFSERFCNFSYRLAFSTAFSSFVLGTCLFALLFLAIATKCEYLATGDMEDIGSYCTEKENRNWVKFEDVLAAEHCSRWFRLVWTVWTMYVWYLTLDGFLYSLGRFILF